MGHGEALKGPRHPQVCCSGVHLCVQTCARACRVRACMRACVRAYVVWGGRVGGARGMFFGMMQSMMPRVQMELQTADESSKVEPLRLLRLANMCARVGDSLDCPAIAPSVPPWDWNARDLNLHVHVRNCGYMSVCM